MLDKPFPAYQSKMKGELSTSFLLFLDLIPANVIMARMKYVRVLLCVMLCSHLVLGYLSSSGDKRYELVVHGGE